VIPWARFALRSKANAVDAVLACVDLGTGNAFVAGLDTRTAVGSLVVVMVGGAAGTRDRGLKVSVLHERTHAALLARYACKEPYRHSHVASLGSGG